MIIVKIALATFGLSLILTREHGPFAVFSRFRNYLEKDLVPSPDQPPNNADAEAWRNYQEYYPEWEIERYSTWQGTLFGIFDCPICIGVYVSLALTAAFYGLQSNLFLVWLASYGGHLFIFRLTEKNNGL